MRIKIIGMLVMVMLSLLLSGAAMAQEEMPPPPGAGAPDGVAVNPALLEEVQKEAGITDDQIKAVKDLLFQHRKANIKLRADIHIAELEMNYALDAEKPDREKVLKFVDQIGALKTSLEKSNVEMRLKMKEIIKPDQEKKLKSIMRTKMKERFEKMKGRTKETRGKEARGKKGGALEPRSMGDAQEAPPSDEEIEEMPEAR